MANWEDRIVANPAVLGGKPVIKGTRLSVEFILELLGNGISIEELLENYPQLKKQDINACLGYASDVLHDVREFPVKA